MDDINSDFTLVLPLALVCLTPFFLASTRSSDTVRLFKLDVDPVDLVVVDLTGFLAVFFTGFLAVFFAGFLAVFLEYVDFFFAPPSTIILIKKKNIKYYNIICLF